MLFPELQRQLLQLDKKYNLMMHASRHSTCHNAYNAFPDSGDNMVLTLYGKATPPPPFSPYGPQKHDMVHDRHYLPVIIPVILVRHHGLPEAAPLQMLVTKKPSKQRT
jgi:hypothetical protein